MHLDQARKLLFRRVGLPRSTFTRTAALMGEAKLIGQWTKEILFEYSQEFVRRSLPIQAVKIAWRPRCACLSANLTA